MHIKERTEILASQSKRKEKIEEATRRLIDVNGMGTQYQFMAISGGNMAPYPFTKPECVTVQ